MQPVQQHSWVVRGVNTISGTTSRFAVCFFLTKVPGSKTTVVIWPMAPLPSHGQGFPVAHRLKPKQLLKQNSLRAFFRSYVHQFPKITYFSAKLGCSSSRILLHFSALEHPASSCFKDQFQCRLLHTIFPNPPFHSSRLPQSGLNLQFTWHVWNLS